MKIRNSLAILENDKTEFDFPEGGIEILGENKRALFAISLESDGSLLISASAFCKLKGKVLEDRLLVAGVASNVIRVLRPVYVKPRKKKEKPK